MQNVLFSFPSGDWAHRVRIGLAEVAVLGVAIAYIIRWAKHVIKDCDKDKCDADQLGCELVERGSAGSPAPVPSAVSL